MRISERLQRGEDEMVYSWKNGAPGELARGQVGDDYLRVVKTFHGYVLTISASESSAPHTRQSFKSASELVKALLTAFPPDEPPLPDQRRNIAESDTGKQRGRPSLASPKNGEGKW